MQFSWEARDPTQMAKVVKIVPRARIQGGLPLHPWGGNLNRIILTLIDIYQKVKVYFQSMDGTEPW